MVPCWLPHRRRFVLSYHAAMVSFWFQIWTLSWVKYFYNTVSFHGGGVEEGEMTSDVRLPHHRLIRQLRESGLEILDIRPSYFIVSLLPLFILRSPWSLFNYIVARLPLGYIHSGDTYPIHLWESCHRLLDKSSPTLALSLGRLGMMMKLAQTTVIFREERMVVWTKSSRTDPSQYWLEQ